MKKLDRGESVIRQMAWEEREALVLKRIAKAKAKMSRLKAERRLVKRVLRNLEKV